MIVQQVLLFYQPCLTFLWLLCWQCYAYVGRNCCCAAVVSMFTIVTIIYILRRACHDNKSCALPAIITYLAPCLPCLLADPTGCCLHLLLFFCWHQQISMGRSWPV